MTRISAKLYEQLQNNGTGKNQKDKDLVKEFCDLSREKLVRSLVLFFVATLVVFFWILFLNFWGHGIWGLQTKPIEKIGDLRKGIDYKNFEGTDITYVYQGGGRENLLLTTRGDGLHRCRIDGGVLGFWEKLTPSNWQLLPEKDLRQVYHEKKRIWFLGKKSSLASCDINFEDWRLHFGGGGFVPRLDLANDITSSAIAEDGAFFAIGTSQRGVGIYDVQTRQWIMTDVIPTDAAVNALITTGAANLPTREYKNSAILWVGSEKGLNGYYLRRDSGVLSLHSAPEWDLPKLLSTQSAKALSLASHSSGKYLQCIVGSGGHLEMNLHKGTWMELVKEADPRLINLEGDKILTDVVPVSDGAWLIVKDYHRVLFYDVKTRSLTFPDTGLPKDGTYTIVQLCKPASSDEVRLLILNTEHTLGQPGIWDYQVYVRKGKKWLFVPLKDEISAIQFLGDDLVARLADGNIKLYSSTPVTLFKPAPFNEQSSLGIAAANSNQLFVEYFQSTDTGDRMSFLARYLPGIRGWERIPGYVNPGSFKELKPGDNTLWTVTKDGELGFFMPLDSRQESPVYHKVYEKFEKYSEKGVTTAAFFQGDFWFVYGGEIYRYSTKNHRREKIKQGIIGINPLRLRTFKTSLYLWGHDKLAKSDKLFVFENPKWEELKIKFNIKEMNTASVSEFPVKEGWRCKRETKPGQQMDTVTFILENNGNGLLNPVSKEGYWLDEYVTAVYPERDFLWLGSKFGLKRYNYSSGQETIEIPGEEIRTIYTANERLHCRTGRGIVYVLENNRWQLAGGVLPEMSGTTGVLSLESGNVRCAVAALKDSRADLLDFDWEARRFNQDIAREISCDREGFWMLTPGKGIRYLKLKDEQIFEQGSFLEGYELSDIRYGSDNTLYVKERANGEGRYWKYQAKTGEFVDVTGDINPYRYAVSGKISPLVTWRRYFVGSGEKDFYRLRLAGIDLPFKEGKLACDYILEAVSLERENEAGGTDIKYWQATPSGMVENDKKEGSLTASRIIPYPQETAASDSYRAPKLVIYDNRLAWNGEIDTYQYDHYTGRWSIDSAAPILPGIYFDGYRWRKKDVKGSEPRISFFLSGTGYVLTTLNDVGQFPFDSIKSSGMQASNLWISYENGLARYAAGEYRAETLIPEFYLHWAWLKEENWEVRLENDPESKIWMALNKPGGYWFSLLADAGKKGCPFRLSTGKEDVLNPFLFRQWLGKVDGAYIRIRIIPSQNAVEVMKNSDKTWVFPLPPEEKIREIEWPGGEQAWILTNRGIYTLNLRKLEKQNESGREERSAEPLFEELYWTDYIKYGKDDGEKWEEIGTFFTNIKDDAMAHGAYTTARLIRWEGEDWAIDGDAGDSANLIRRTGINDYDWIGSVLGDRAKEKATKYGGGRVSEWQFPWYLYDLAAELDPAKPSNWLTPLLSVSREIARIDKDNRRQWQLLAGVYWRFGESGGDQAVNCLTVDYLLGVRDNVEAHPETTGGNKKLLRGVQGGGFLEKSPPDRRRPGNAAAVIREVKISDDKWVGTLGKQAIRDDIYGVAGEYAYIPWNLFSLAIEVNDNNPTWCEWWTYLYKIVIAEKDKKERWEELGRVYEREGMRNCAQGAYTIGGLLGGQDYSGPGNAVEVLAKVNITDTAWIGKLAGTAKLRGSWDLAWDLYLRAAAIESKDKAWEWINELIVLIRMGNFRDDRARWKELGDVWRVYREGCYTISWILGSHGVKFENVAVRVIEKLGINDDDWIGELAFKAEERGNESIAWELYFKAASIQAWQWQSHLVELIGKPGNRNQAAKWAQLGKVWADYSRGCDTISWILGNNHVPPSLNSVRHTLEKVRINDDAWIGALGDKANNRSNSPLSRELYELARKLNPAKEEWWRKLNLCRLTVRPLYPSNEVHVNDSYWGKGEQTRAVEAGRHYVIKVYNDYTLPQERTILAPPGFFTFPFE